MTERIYRVLARVREWLATDPPDRDDPEDRVW